MSEISSIIGTVKLNPNIDGMPDGGLTINKHRVELAEENKPDFAWMTEIIVLGDLPWYEGEERQVEIRIMTDEFREYVISKKPDLLVRRGSQFIGDLHF